MRGIILAAGAGRRVNGEVKALLDIGGRTIISRLIDQLESAGIRSPVVVVGHRAELIMNHLGSRTMYVYNRRYADTGSAESLFLAMNALHPEKDFVVVHGDTVFDKLTVASVARSPDTVALTPYDGKGHRVHTVGGRAIVPSESASISGLGLWSWAGIVRAEAPCGLLGESKGSAVAIIANLNAIHGQSVNVNTLSDLEDARRFCA